MQTIVASEIDNLYLTSKNEKQLKSHLEVQLGILIDKVVERIKTNNNKTTQGWLKQGLMDSFINVEEIKQGIPGYAEAMMKEMTSAKTESQLKTLLKSRIESYVEETFDVNDATLKEIIVAKAGGNEDVAKNKLEKILDRNAEVIGKLSLYLILLTVFIFILEAFNKGPVPQSQYILLTLTLIVLLLVGVATPMIDMEAKISKLTFVLLGHNIEFENQVLFFQSKSIMDVFNIMILHKQLQMKLVGILMVCFSIVFPTFKMLSSLAYYYDYCRARSYRLVQFFVLKSGKWSMADVMVVAIFMAYIGFNGIINSQLDNIKESSPDLAMLTTNGTTLMPGFYIFMTYTILAMFLSGFLKKRPYDCNSKA